MSDSAITKLLNQVLKGQAAMAASLANITAEIQTLTASVASNNSVQGSAVTLLQGLSAQITAISQQLAAAIANEDETAIQAASDALTAQEQALDSNTAQLAAAVAANTPASGSVPPAAAPPAGAKS
jgi:hypothetical protein